MVDRLIATTPATGYRQLGVHGQPVVGAYRQLKAILAGNLSPDHAALLTQPRIDPQGARIDWYSDRPGPSGRVADLPADMQASARARAEKLIADIAGLAEKLTREGGASELVGRMLTLATTTPGPEWLYVSAEQPMLVLWGHDREGVAAVPVPTGAPLAKVPAASPPAASPAPTTPSSSPPPAQPQPQPQATQPQPTLASGPAVAIPPATGRGVWGWLLWLLPLLLLLLLIALAFRACQPLPPVVVEVPGAAPPATDPTPALEARIAALESERDRLRHEAEVRPQCVPVDPTPPQKAEDLPPLPQTPPPNKAEETPEPPKVEPPVNKAEVEPPPPVPQVKPEPPPAPKPSPPPVNKAEAPPPAPKPTPTPAPAPQASCQPNFQPGDEPEVVLIVDGSGSMKEPFPGASSRIDMAKRSVDNMVRGLPPGIEVGLIDFQSCDNVRRDKFYGDAERGQLIGEVNRLSPWGGTPLARSIERAGNIVSGDVDSVIVVVSDGEESCGGDPCAAARALKAAKPKAIVNVIDISGDAGSRAVIQCVAQATGGQVLKADSAQDMMRKMQQATRQPDMRACKK